MPIEFLADSEGRSILGVRGGPHNWFLRRQSLYHVNAAKLSEFAAKYQLTDFRKAYAAIYLNRQRSLFNLTDTVDTRPADTTVANWIEKLRPSVIRIATKVESDTRMFEVAFEAIFESAWNWAQKQDDDTLASLGFPNSRTLENRSMDVRMAIRNWLRQAMLMQMLFGEAAEKLRERKIPRGHKGMKGLIPNGPGKEVFMFGAWLPYLYKRLTRRPFGISVSSKTQKVMNTTGVAFAIDAAQVIGLHASPASVADSFNDIKRYLKSQGRMLPAPQK